MGTFLSTLNIRNGTDAMVPDVAFDIESKWFSHLDQKVICKGLFLGEGINHYRWDSAQ
jgi:hypothetical protein